MAVVCRVAFVPASRGEVARVTRAG